MVEERFDGGERIAATNIWFAQGTREVAASPARWKTSKPVSRTVGWKLSSTAKSTSWPRERSPKPAARKGLRSPAEPKVVRITRALRSLSYPPACRCKHFPGYHTPLPMARVRWCFGDEAEM